MNDFKDIKAKWEQRNIPEIPKDGHREIIKSSLYIKRKQRATQLILMVTVVALLCFFLYTSAFKNTQSTWGMLLMISSLFFRVVIEFFSGAKFKSLAPTLQFKEFSKKMMAFYKSRLLIHFLITPVLFILYVIGFMIMLPIFKLHLSAGFYHYVIISSILIFMVLILVISIQITKELRIINEMKRNMDHN
ncbi:hypothetical protein [Pedobacter caeni]|uniref:Uncharacterized protein n=1 Tax=Pedobacter caeni TaxID=288992 RepID=A0A1M4UFQ6_9SPHI|nr:hypothetical protein [Pedobacter caeni]SHE55622.1 hypothetical protein SAMN04488522_101545 [Pedobacter caeni]